MHTHSVRHNLRGIIYSPLGENIGSQATLLDNLLSLIMGRKFTIMRSTFNHDTQQFNTSNIHMAT